MDPRIIDLPFLFRWLLVHGIILPLRPKKSAKAYNKVWTNEGSPLMVNGEKLRDGVKAKLGDRAEVFLAMRYGNPSIKSVIKKTLDTGSGNIVIVPLYPQYAAATTGSTVEKVFAELKQYWNVPPVQIVPDFYEDRRFIEPAAAIAKPLIDSFKADHILFSYHGLPESHLRKTSEVCLGKTCCETINSKNRYCYRAQCVATTKALVKELNLDDNGWSMAFQSRLGKAEWVKPYTTDLIEDLAAKGKKRLAVLCPAFVSDCLETIEEIGMEAKDDFVAAGGEDLLLIPCVNADERWVRGTTELVSDYLD